LFVLTHRRRKTVNRVSGMVLAALALSFAVPAQPASAQSLFEALFGGFRRPAPRDLPPSTGSFADPLGIFGNARGRPSGEYSGQGLTYCVRTCDGRFFPLQRHANASPAELCKSFCPASKTMVFSGSKIDHAVAPNGTRYADLDNAFVYRERMVDDCTCNGKDAFGVARVNVATDSTLKPGDIVATNDGITSYKGRNSKSAEFTPISASSSEWSRRLSATKVTPQPEPKLVQPVADDTPARKDRRRAVQLSR
jgi:hypothetical protein